MAWTDAARAAAAAAIEARKSHSTAKKYYVANPGHIAKGLKQFKVSLAKRKSYAASLRAMRAGKTTTLGNADAQRAVLSTIIRNHNRRFK